jgi:hypothetical protein
MVRVMDWQCPKCGGRPVRDDGRQCEACNFIEFGQLVLTSAAGISIVANIDTVFGKGALKDVLGADDARYLSAAQFRVSRDVAVGGWVIAHDSGAVNQTYIDGVPVGASPCPLRAGSTISVGPALATLTVRVI